MFWRLICAFIGLLVTLLQEDSYAQVLEGINFVSLLLVMYASSVYCCCLF